MYRGVLSVVFFLAVIGTINVTVHPVVEAQIVEDGLVGHWTFDDGDVTDTTVEDVHGDIVGTILGLPQVVPGKIGDALEFNGIDDAIDLGSPADGSLDFGPDGDFTFMAWVKVSELPAAGQSTIVSKGDRGSNPRILFKINATQIFTTIKEGGTGINVTSDRAIVDGQWHHLTFLADRDEATRLYVDGILDTEGEPSIGANVNTTSPMYIGASVREGPQTRRFFKGLMDDVAIYNRALTVEEILQNISRGGCTVRRVLARPPLYTPGGTVTVMLEATNITEPTTVTETIPDGWSVSNSGGGSIDANKLAFVMTADGKASYELTAPADGCGPVTLGGSVAGGGGCDGEVVGDANLGCIPQAPGAEVYDFDTKGPTTDAELEDFFDFLGAENSVGPMGWRLDPNAQNSANGSKGLHTTGDTGELENWFSRVALLRSDVFEARDLFFSVDLTLDGLSGNADDHSGVFFRFRGDSDLPLENDYYFLRINAGGNQSNIHLHRVKDGFEEQPVASPGNNIPFLVQEGDTVTVTVRAMESEIEIFLNGEPVPGMDPFIDDFDPILSCGQVGVGQNSNPTYFDNLTVTSLDGGPCPCAAIRRLSRLRYEPGDSVTVSLKATNITGATTITETFPDGWSVTNDGGGTVNGNTIAFNLDADAEVSYELTIPDVFCDTVAFTGKLTGADGCDSEVFGKSRMSCVFGCGDLQESGAISEMLIIGPIDLGGDPGPNCDDNGMLGETDYLAGDDVDEASVQAVFGDELQPDFLGRAGGVGVAFAANPDINPLAAEGILTVWLALADRDGRINFNDADNVGTPPGAYVIYSLVYLDNTTVGDLNVNLRIGSNDAVKVILNGEQVHLNPVCRGIGNVDNRDHVPVTLIPGINTLLIAEVGESGTDVRLLVYDEFDALPLTDGSVVACLSSGAEPPPTGGFRRGDTDASGVVDISDPIFNLTFQFVGGIDPPPAPGEKECGPDPAVPADDLGCAIYPQERC